MKLLKSNSVVTEVVEAIVATGLKVSGRALSVVRLLVLVCEVMSYVDGSISKEALEEKLTESAALLLYCDVVGEVSSLDVCSELADK